MLSVYSVVHVIQRRGSYTQTVHKAVYSELGLTRTGLEEADIVGARLLMRLQMLSER
jgi:hypothetical protein